MPEPEEASFIAPVVASCDWPGCGWTSEPAEPIRAQAALLVHLHEEHEQPI
jgi:hypothetical protein